MKAPTLLRGILRQRLAVAICPPPQQGWAPVLQVAVKRLLRTSSRKRTRTSPTAVLATPLGV
eukprot:13623695-Alexandrium_andersonii.AAC.1